MSEDRIDLIRSLIRDIPDFPKQGILFKDITPLLANHEGFVTTLDLIQEHWASHRPDVLVGIESRGFIFGAALAARMAASFVPARKPGKLPYQTHRAEYDLEYGTDAVEMHVDAIVPGSRVLVVDDLIATGGTAAATVELVRRQEGEVIGAAFVIELGFLKGRDKLPGVDILSLLTF